VKTTHKKIAVAAQDIKSTHQITFEGRTEEFDGIIDALENSHDNKVQQLAAYIRKALNHD